MHFRFAILMIVLLTLGCTDRKEPLPAGPGERAAVWADYKVWAAAGDSMATCMLQFFAGPKKRQGMRLPPPAEVFVDGVPLQADSAGLSGVFYEYRAPLALFAGPHTIELKDEAGRRFVDRFQYAVFNVSALPAQAQKAYLLNLEGLPAKSKIRVVLTDTAFGSEGYNEFLPVTNGRLLIDSSILNTLKKGPVQLYLSAEEDRMLRSGLPGAISITYSAGGSFELAH